MDINFFRLSCTFSGRAGLFQHVGPEERLVCLLEFRQILGLDIRQIPRALLERPARQRRGALAFGGPDDTTLLVVDDDGGVLVVPAVTEFVDADQPQAIQTIDVRFLGALDHPPDQRAYSAPGRSQQGDDGGLAALLSEKGGALLEGVGKVAAVRRPEDTLGLHCLALGAVSPPEPVAQMQRHARQVVMAPTPLTQIMNRSALGAAFTTTWNRPGRGHIHDQARRAELEVADGAVTDAEQDSEHRGGAQGGAWAEDVETRSLASPPRASTLSNRHATPAWTPPARGVTVTTK